MYSTPILVIVMAVTVLGAVALFWRFSNKAPLAEESATTSAPAHVVSEEQKLKVMDDLAQANGPVTTPIKKKEEILKSARVFSAGPDSPKSGASSGLSERQMEIMHSLRYSQ